MRFNGFVGPDGSFRPWDNHRWVEWLRKHKGQRIEVELRDEKAIRSSRQNRYWWGVIVPFFADQFQRERGDALPLPHDVVHDVLVFTFATGERSRETPFGTGRRSSASMTTVVFTEMIDRARESARERYQSEIPSPEEWGDD